MMLAQFLLASLSELLAGSCSTSSSLVRVEPAGISAIGTITVAALPAEHPVRLILAIKHSNVSALEATFWAVSDPKSPRYGQYLTQDALSRLIAPDPAAREAVSKYVKCVGASLEVGAKLEVISRTPGGEWIEILGATARSAGALLNCMIVGGPEGPACAGGVYHLPAHVARHVSFVSGMGGRRRRLRNASAGGGQRQPPHAASGNAMACGGYGMTPAKLRALYGVPAGTVATAAATQATAQFHTPGPKQNAYSAADLKQFHSSFGLAGSPPPKVVDVGPNEPPWGKEGTLDVQYLTGVAAGEATTTWWNTNDTCSFEQWVIEARERESNRMPSDPHGRLGSPRIPTDSLAHHGTALVDAPTWAF